ncbi:MAG TPA: hypothetical protein VJS64_15275 [Pyrinomonadaceae bacterium]|nr:hypothetical protein [Pyrinomonadaceae bacterium]
MTRKRKKIRRLLFRVFASEKGEVFLQLESGGPVVLVARPVTSGKLDEAKKDVIERAVAELRTDVAAKPGISPERQQAHKEIEAALDPIRKGRWLSRAEYVVNYLIIRGFTFLFSLVLITFAYKGVTYSSEHFPEKAHFVVLGVFILGLAFLVWLIGTEENRIKYHSRVKDLFGPRGMLVLPIALLGTASSVMASLTFRLYSHGKIALETCSGRAVTEAGLMDFYVWHFFNIVPLLQLNNLIRWGEPYCYKQSRVGFLILVFQLLVVIPSFNAIRFFWRNRKIPSDYVFDPHWRPEATE